jgi:hypothetical protein
MSRSVIKIRDWQDSEPQFLAYSEGEGHYTGIVTTEQEGTLILQLTSTRPLVVRINGAKVLHESLWWRSFQREINAVICFPINQGDHRVTIEAYGHPAEHEHRDFVDNQCQSRNRESVVLSLSNLRPDGLRMTVFLDHKVQADAYSIRFLPNQFYQETRVWQHILVRTSQLLTNDKPTIDFHDPRDIPVKILEIMNAETGEQAREGTTDADLRQGYRRFYVPIDSSDNPSPLVRADGQDAGLEPYSEIVQELALCLTSTWGKLTLQMPVYESLGKLAPKREYQSVRWPSWEEAGLNLPVPIVPNKWAHLVNLYNHSWKLLFQLVASPSPDSGMPNEYIRTAMTSFNHLIFVWDSSFTAISSAYGFGSIPVFSSLDVLYSRQFDGGYIHREHDVISGLPVLFEPDFGPNPPIMSVAEWSLFEITGDLDRVRSVYPALKSHHHWISENRKLPDGTFWTTGLASGLDNAPSYGEGQPDLTAQMAHDADILARMARLLGEDRDAMRFAQEYEQINLALNSHLWNTEKQIYAPSLAEGGHNPHKLITSFWPLFAGVAPEEKIEQMIKHAGDESSFWRKHPFPSLAADSPDFQPSGGYWRGSVWAPTNYMAISGIKRAGFGELARKAALAHLENLSEVLNATGALWENYSSEQAAPGNHAQPEYSWTTLGPIALLMEVVLGLKPDAWNDTLYWSPPAQENIGIKQFPLGNRKIDIMQIQVENGVKIQVLTTHAFTLKLSRGQEGHTFACSSGFSEFIIREVGTC